MIIDMGHKDWAHWCYELGGVWGEIQLAIVDLLYYKGSKTLDEIAMVLSTYHRDSITSSIRSLRMRGILEEHAGKNIYIPRDERKHDTLEGLPASKIKALKGEKRIVFFAITPTNGTLLSDIIERTQLPIERVKLALTWLQVHGYAAPSLDPLHHKNTFFMRPSKIGQERWATLVQAKKLKSVQQKKLPINADDKQAEEKAKPAELEKPKVRVKAISEDIGDSRDPVLVHVVNIRKRAQALLNDLHRMAEQAQKHQKEIIALVAEIDAMGNVRGAELRATNAIQIPPELTKLMQEYVRNSAQT